MFLDINYYYYYYNISYKQCGEVFKLKKIIYIKKTNSINYYIYDMKWKDVTTHGHNPYNYNMYLTLTKEESSKFNDEFKQINLLEFYEICYQVIDNKTSLKNNYRLDNIFYNIENNYNISDNMGYNYIIINNITGKKFISSTICLVKRILEICNGNVSNVKLKNDIKKFGLINFTLISELNYNYKKINRDKIKQEKNNNNGYLLYNM